MDFPSPCNLPAFALGHLRVTYVLKVCFCVYLAVLPSIIGCNGRKCAFALTYKYMGQCALEMAFSQVAAFGVGNV
jgi:hypothetical protein